MGMICALAALLGFDQFAKSYAEKHFTSGGKEILGGRVKLRKLHNKGIMLGKFSDDPDKVKVGTGIATGLILLQWLILLTKKGSGWHKTVSTLITAGAVSNYTDRLTRGYVVDYFSVMATRIFRSEKKFFKKIESLVFNLGDIFIFLGGIVAVVVAAFSKDKK